MGSIMRMPGESETDYRRRVIKTESPNLDPDLIVGPATTGARFAGETETAWKERLADHYRYFAPGSSKTEDSDADDR
jgi:hypothetical protein